MLRETRSTAGGRTPALRERKKCFRHRIARDIISPVKPIPFLTVLLLLTLPAHWASAQLSIRIGKDGGYRSGSYEGYWSPHSTPDNFSHRMGSIDFVNDAPGVANIYHVDRYGRWTWVKALQRGEKTSVNSPIGDIWAIRGNRDSVTERVVARPERQKVVIRYDQHYDGDRYGPRREDRFNVVFRNRSRRPVVVYALHPWGEWKWAGAVPPRGGELEVRAFDRQQFRVTDQRGRVVENYRADSDDRRVTISSD